MVALVHITHEAQDKMGGIGAVLEGLLTTRAYQGMVDRTVLVGTAEVPLRRPPQELQAVYYETGGWPTDAPSPVRAPVEAFHRIEAAYGVRLFYGRRAVLCPLETRRSAVEMLLLDVRDARPEPVNRLKAELWEAYGLQSDQFEHDWGYEEWVRAAAPALEAIEAIREGRPQDTLLISHEFMGLPTLLAARLRTPAVTTVYWAHEVPSVRDLIEQDNRHRLGFDQAMRTPHGIRSYETLLRAAGGFKHALICRAHWVDRIFAVSDRIVQELGLLSGAFRRTPIEVVYNGLPVRPIDLEARLHSRGLLLECVEGMVGFRPDFVFTHVARPVASKAIERDLAVLRSLDDLLAERGRTAVLLVLATDGGRRDPESVRQMESEYGWPLNHRIGWPDLVKGEIPIGQAAQHYNEWARATRVILINQFSFSRETCGRHVPEETRFQDLRQGSDVEFGQSAYEPFGIAQLETLAFGGISVLSGVCGCAQLLERVAGDKLPANILFAHYAAPTPDGTARPLSDSDARRIEHEVAARLAKELVARLPTHREAFEALLESGWALAEKLSWQTACREYFVPALRRCLRKKPIRPPQRLRTALPDSHPVSPF